MCRSYVFILSALLCCFLLMCSGEKTDDGRLRICFAFQDLETEFWVAAHEVITQTLEEKGIKVIERNASQDANKQLEQIRDAIAQQVDGIIFIPQDGQSALTIIDEANEAGIPIAVFNRPPADSSKNAIVIVADNETIAEKAVDYMVKEAQKRDKKSTPLILVGDLGDPNAVERKSGFYNAIEKHPELFNEVTEVPTKWDAVTTLANLQSALQANPEVDFLFTSSDFLYPQVRAVLEQMGKWNKRGEPGHVILGGLDGDKTACRLMQEGYVDATGVQDLFFEADKVMSELLAAIEQNNPAPKKWIQDPGFALTQENYAERHLDMWGCALLDQNE